MPYDITALKADLEGVLHGTTLNQITNLDGLIDRAARDVLLDVDPQETKRITPFTNPIFNQVFDYAVPEDLKGNKVIDIRPQVNRQLYDVWPQSYNQAFDLLKNWTVQSAFTINFNSSIKTIRLNSPQLPWGVLLNDASTLNGNGTWSVGGGATNLQVDNINYVCNGGSLQFDLSAGPTTGYIENSTMSSIDISNQLNQGTEFLYTYLPVPGDFTNVIFRWGSSSSDYYSVTATVTQQNTTFQTGWNLLAFNWLGATVVGSPDPSDITYLRVTWTYDGTAQTGVQLNNIASRMGSILEIEYYSKYLFRDAITGAYQETVTDDSNLINLDTETYDLLFYKVAHYASQQQQGVNAIQYDGKFFLDRYKEIKDRYMALYKSEVQKPQQSYYAKPNPNYARFINNWYR